MIRFVEVVNETNFNPRMERTSIPRFPIAEVWINEKYVVNVRSAPEYKKMLHEGRIDLDLDDQHEFAVITTNEGDSSRTHVVVGEVSYVARRLAAQEDRQRQLLKG